MNSQIYKNNRRVVLAYLLWLLLAICLAYVAWNLHATVVALTAIWVKSPYRPFGWTSESVQPFSRLSIFVIGSAAMIYGLWLENRVQRAGREGHLWPYVFKTLLGLAITLTICLLLLRL